MKIVIIEKPGSYNKLLIKEKETPIPKDDEVHIECRACGVNFADCCVRMGVYTSAKIYVGWPITPGFEVSGIIKNLGKNVSHLSLNDRVVAVTLFGGYTTDLIVNANQVFPLPNSLSFEQGAAIPATFLTASYAMNELAHPRQGQTLLIHSAAGGVGSALVQLGKLAKCRLIGVIGASHKKEALTILGADGVIDKSTNNLWKEAEKLCPEGYDVIFDANGPETLRQSYHHLAPGGKLVVYGFHTMLTKGKGKPNWVKVIWDYIRCPRFNPMNMTGDNHSVLAFNLSYLFDKNTFLRREMETLLSLFKVGLLKPPKIATFPLEKVAEAHQALESGQTVGKLVLTIHKQVQDLVFGKEKAPRLNDRK